MQIDAKGKACPQPVILAKKELDGGCSDLTVLVDNRAAVENLTRLGGSMGMQITSGDAEGGFFVHFAGVPVPGVSPVIVCAPSGNGYAVFIGKDVVGAGDASCLARTQSTVIEPAPEEMPPSIRRRSALRVRVVSALVTSPTVGNEARMSPVAAQVSCQSPAVLE